MKRAHLFEAFAQARRLTGHTEFVVIGSLSILGTDDGVRQQVDADGVWFEAVRRQRSTRSKRNKR